MLVEKQAFICALRNNQLIKLLFHGQRAELVYQPASPHLSSCTDKGEAQHVHALNRVHCVVCKSPIEFELYAVCLPGDMSSFMPDSAAGLVQSRTSFTG